MSAENSVPAEAPTVPVGEVENANAIFITYAAIITMAVIPIYIGSFRSMTSKISASLCKKKKKKSLTRTPL